MRVRLCDVQAHLLQTQCEAHRGGSVWDVCQNRVLRNWEQLVQQGRKMYEDVGGVQLHSELLLRQPTTPHWGPDDSGGHADGDARDVLCVLEALRTSGPCVFGQLPLGEALVWHLRV
jgi:hypothetical protein